MENTLLLVVHPDDGLVDLKPLVKHVIHFMDCHSLIKLEIDLLEIVSMLYHVDEGHFLCDAKQQKIEFLKSIVQLLKVCRNAD